MRIGGGCSGKDGSCSVHFGKHRKPTTEDDILRMLAAADQKKLAKQLADDPTYGDKL